VKLDILAIAAHPGDAEASCGGTLIRMAAQGYRTGVLDLTSGEAGWYPAAEARLDEARIAAERLGLAWRDNQRMPEGRLENSLAARMTVAVRIRELQPRVVILPFGEEGGDPDQIHGRELGAEACFLAGVAALEEYSAPHRPERILYASLFADVRPSFVVDVSAQFEARVEALRSYPEGPGAAALDRMEALARFHGSRIGVPYAEPFVLKEALAVRDIVEM
jgi:bacillithiol biosynthesis deacetylase BshB1